MKNNDYKFQDMIEQKLFPSTNIINMEILQMITILIYQSHILDLETCLWKTCLIIAIDDLEESESNYKVWPLRIRTMIQYGRCQTTISNPHDIQFTDENHLDFIREHFENLNERQQQINKELMKYKTNIVGFTDNLEQILQTFVEENIQFVRLQYYHAIKLIKFDYREQLLDYKFQKQNPTSQQMNNNKLLQILSNIQHSLSFKIQSLTDTDLLNPLSNHYQQNIQKYRQEISKIIIDTLQAELNEFQALFENEITGIWQSQR
ncbi:unnamed protein product, partial [Adineta steineri]